MTNTTPFKHLAAESTEQILELITGAQVDHWLHVEPPEVQQTRVCANGIRRILDLTTEAGARCFPGANADPQKEHVTAWTILPASTDYFPATQPVVVDYIVDDLDALLDRFRQEEVRIDVKQASESYGRLAWIYDLVGNKTSKARARRLF